MDSEVMAAGRVHGRRAFIAALAVYGFISFRTPDIYRFLDSVNLPIHETGHLVFAPLGEFMGFLGGTLFQLMIPLAFVIYFWRRNDRFAASIVLFWVAQNFWNIARYIADARSQVLPLVGGGVHDWGYLLGRLGWLRYDHFLSTAVRGAGFLVFALSIYLAWRFSGVRGRGVMVLEGRER